MSKLEPEMEVALRELVNCMMDTHTYREYQKCKQDISQDQRTIELVRRSRQISNELQRIPEGERSGDYVERLEQEYADLSENTAVHNFNAAEVALCNMYQEMMKQIISVL